MGRIRITWWSARTGFRSTPEKWHLSIQMRPWPGNSATKCHRAFLHGPSGYLYPENVGQVFGSIPISEALNTLSS
ncbi:hypothetical protein [Arcticibacter tournemirensis]